ncbi:alpha/beta hydrolase [Qipengyuania sp. 6B39]|uniref:alpha/beta hydrolase n=1 Tax=Qipengyuania proteolytica TaxID=2867239 RepID=UPI001C8AA53C|nr:alpha/beta hydrolase [Qipengyuania proteolytica]MBX7496991.1 alpha/beta hydrolase [Qipengyuania proteolytica]
MAGFTFVSALLATALHSGFHPRPCTDERIAEIARCGTIDVPEDRNLPEGRTISLNIVVLPALSDEPHDPPIFDIDGGPGLPSTKNAEFYATFGSAYRAKRDIVLIDQRGTGSSNPLTCPELSDPDNAYVPFLPVDAVERCRRSLEVSADLTKYGTAEAVADLDDVRSALGYEKLNIFALSYGTTVALRYMATHPDRVRAAVLMGVSPADATPPRMHAPAGQSALDMLIEDCRADTACAASFEPNEDIALVRENLPTIDGAPPVEVFFEKLRSLMYTPQGARMVPLILDRAAARDLSPFYEATRPRGPSLYADGMFLSVICSEGISLMDLSAARAEAATTVFGDYRLRRQAEACSIWPSQKPNESHLLPVHSDVPVLLISGERDPVTPPVLADNAARTLTGAKHIVIPRSGHVFDGMSGIEECLDPLILDFFEAAMIELVDDKCVSQMKAPSFVTEVTTASPSEQ